MKRTFDTVEKLRIDEEKKFFGLSILIACGGADFRAGANGVIAITTARAGGFPDLKVCVMSKVRGANCAKVCETAQICGAILGN